jgi:hypothetical protein
MPNETIKKLEEARTAVETDLHGSLNTDYGSCSSGQYEWKWKDGKTTIDIGDNDVDMEVTLTAIVVTEAELSLIRLARGAARRKS